ncbi:ATP-binding protein [Sphaerisporangium sp. NPDC005289]|uniref:ATP-binding protein n=1 Tax=Sphaerisporangium sp. NPDC005289 TaxID=3155247 RepID=UPI0033A7E69E
MSVSGTPTWPLTTLLELGALPSAVRCARVHAKLVLREWGLDSVGEDAELIVSELVTNAITVTRRLSTPAPPPVRLRLLSDHQRLIIEVWDASVEPPLPAEPDPMSSHGRGLVLVESLSAKWAWTLTPQWGGKVVWCEVGV